MWFQTSVFEADRVDYIPYGRQDITEDDIFAVQQVLSSDYLTQGPKVPQFESALSEYCGVRHAVAVNSATSALHIACRALDVQKGDIVWTSPITFAATSNAALQCGATVDFIDIDLKSFNICCDELERKLQIAEQNNKIPKVVIPVHMCGQACDMKRIAELASKYGFSIIEDASHAVGGEYKSRKVGSCRHSDITVFSFHPVKIITTGEGGAALTNDKRLADKMVRLRSHGITRESGQLERKNPEAWHYEQLDLGYNYRMTDIAASLGCSQMNRLDEYIKARQLIAKRYQKSLSELPIDLPWINSDVKSSYHLYVIILEPSMITRRESIFNKLRSSGIGVNVHYMPVYHHPYYRELGFQSGYCKKAEEYYLSCLTLPIFPKMTKDEQDYVVSVLTGALQE